jgi:hypothetical protein
VSLRRSFSLLLVVLAPLVAGAWAEHDLALEARGKSQSVDRHVMIPAPRAARIMSLGYNELAADLAWVRMLIYYGDGIQHDTGNPDTEDLVRLINVLNPRFRRAYVWGAYATTMRTGFATQDEYAASVEILRRGIEVFPDDWELNWILGVRLNTELRTGTPDELRSRKEEGAMYIERAMYATNAPADLPILAASLRTRLGQKEQALRDLREMIFMIQDEKARQLLINKYAGMVSQTAGQELAEAADAFNREWKANLPYVPPTFYVLVGAPPSPRLDLAALERALWLVPDVEPLD